MDWAQCREEKKSLRREVARRVAALEEEYMQRSDAAIAAQVLALEEYRAANTLFCFVSMEREVETRPILMDALRGGKRVGVPLCVGKGLMEIREIRGFHELSPGMLGILEPSRECPVLAAEDIDFAVVPCVSFDRVGRRLGHGGGYYDRYLENAAFPAAVICREQILCERVPTEEHDIPLKILITENGVIRL